MASAPAALSSCCVPLLLVLSSSILSFSQAQDCGPQCATRNCDDDGVCRCDLPSDSTVLDGDRPFLGGEFCTTPRTMCDGSNTFWCESGACNEIIQGENYTCLCKEGYAGEHCELEGIPCGDLYCYHDAQCIQADNPCDCPADWEGSPDCSLPTLKSSTNGTDNLPIKAKDHDNNKWYVPFSVAIAVTVVALAVFCGVTQLKKRSSEDFHKLRQVQMRGFIDEEDEETFSQAPLSKAPLA